MHFAVILLFAMAAHALPIQQAGDLTNTVGNGDKLDMILGKLDKILLKLNNGCFKDPEKDNQATQPLVVLPPKQEIEDGGKPINLPAKPEDLDVKPETLPVKEVEETEVDEAEEGEPEGTEVPSAEESSEEEVSSSEEVEVEEEVVEEEEIPAAEEAPEVEEEIKEEEKPAEPAEEEVVDEAEEEHEAPVEETEVEENKETGGTISISLGNGQGEWAIKQSCPNNGLGNSIRSLVTLANKTLDSIFAIELTCEQKDLTASTLTSPSVDTATATLNSSDLDAFWIQPITCPPASYLAGFHVQTADPTNALSPIVMIFFGCASDDSGDMQVVQDGYDGSDGWTVACPAGTAFCGLNTKFVLEPLADLVGVHFDCCQLP